MAMATILLQTILIFAAMLITFQVLKKFVLSKFNINKWIPAGIAGALLLLQFALRTQNDIKGIALNGITLLFFLWFLDLNQGSKQAMAKKGEAKIRPKAKPNRVKNMNKGIKEKQ
ncbi:MAG: hypothetical protein ABRQ25_02765 [Clostridiaceae bacterium]